ncbi:MAG: carboxypeptidase regulatory-like domain-containing protein [Pyrinomonadaceae bacterium]
MFISVRNGLITLLFVIGLFAGANCIAQDLDDVSIAGKVVDSNGDPIAGATVEAVFISTGISRVAQTDTSGKYHFIDLTPGTYKLRVSQDGFGVKETDNFDTLSAQNISLDFSLDPAGVTAEQTIVFAENAPIVDVTRTVVGSTLSEREIEDLPNTSNNVLDLVYTLGGTAEEPLSIRNLASDDRIGSGSESDQPTGVIGTGSISLAGGAAYSTNITIDGMDNNDDRSAEERFQPSPDSVAEVQVIQNQFSSEYGRASGGRINIRTRAGSRKFRGRAFLFYENAKMNANTYNNNRRGLSRLPYEDYDPGFTLGGPIPFGYFNNRTYFFTSYEYQTRNASTQIFSAVPVNQNPLFPLPAPTNPNEARPDLNDPTSALIAPYIATVDTPTDRQRFTARIDHNFNDSHNITFNYQLGRSNSFRQYRETTRYLEDTLQGRVRNNDSYYLTDNYVVNNNFVNQARFQFSNYRPDFSTVNPTDPVVLLYISDETTTGPDQVRGTVVVGNSTANFANTRSEKRYQFQDTANFVKGDQNIRVGVDYQAIRSSINELSDSTGTFNFENVDGFLANQIVRYRRNTGAISKLNNDYLGLFVQYDWRMRSDITVGLGLRYERESIVDDNNNFGPRLGIAWALDKNDKSVLRFGAGIFYNRTLLRTIDDFTIESNLESFDSNRLYGTSDEPACFGTTSVASRDECVFLRYVSQNLPKALTLDEIRAIPGISNIEAGFQNTTPSRRLDSNIKIPESYQFNIGYERDLGNGFALEANFTYNKAVHLWRERNINAFQLPAGFNSFTDYLISLGDIEIPGTTSGTDIYRFELGSTADTNGDANAVNGSDCTSSTPLCVVNLNTTNASTSTLEPIGIARRVLQATLGRPISNNIDEIDEVGSMGNSVYEGFSLELRRRYRRLGWGFGGSMNLSYTLSRTRDDGFVDTSSAQIQGDFRDEFSRSLIDRRHKFRLSGTYDMPNYLGKLKLSPIFRLESGRPFNISIGGSDRNLDDVGTDRPNYMGKLRDIVWHNPNDPFPQVLFEGFSLSPIGSRGGNLPRNAGQGPPLLLFDLNISRDFKFGERFKIRPQISFDNILNATVYSFGSDYINLSTAGTPEFEQGFLTPSRTMRQRKIQLGLRFDF